jgi:hypothetical protein
LGADLRQGEEVAACWVEFSRGEGVDVVAQLWGGRLVRRDGRFGGWVECTGGEIEEAEWHFAVA